MRIWNGQATAEFPDGYKVIESKDKGNYFDIESNMPQIALCDSANNRIIQISNTKALINNVSIQQLVSAYHVAFMNAIPGYALCSISESIYSNSDFGIIQYIHGDGNGWYYSIFTFTLYKGSILTINIDGDIHNISECNEEFDEILRSIIFIY